MSKSSKQEKAKRLIKKYLYMFYITMKWIIITGIIFGFLVGGVAFGFASALIKDEPLRSKEEILTKLQEHSVTGFIYFNDDTLIGQIRSNEDRRLIGLSEIPDNVIDAFLAVEDKDFRTHPGVNFRGFFRAVKQQLLNEPVQTGGSSITQQITKLTFFTNDQTISRKAKEIMLSLRMERYISKDEILEAYLNKIPFGNGSSGYYVYGIKAASQGIFDIDNMSRLNNAQAAYLAGLPQNPNAYSAFQGNGVFDQEGFTKAVDRQRLVLKRMYEENKLTKQEYDEALAFDIKSSLASTKQKAYSTYPYLMQESERKAAEALVKLTNPELTADDFRDGKNAELINQAREDLRSGYRIYTTIDKTLYDAMQQIGQNPENFTPDDEEKGIEQIGAIMLDNKTSAILAMLEGRDFYEEQLNHATQMVRQPGSTMKPIAAFLPALENGDIQPASIIDDIPIVFKDGSKGFHIPNNWNLKFNGLITARHALNQSYNIPALKVFNDVVTIDKAWAFAETLGITTITESDHHAQTGVIGGLEYGTSVEELTNAYAAIANKGTFNDAYMIRKIEDPSGEVIYEHQSNPTTVFSEETSYLMTDMLRTVIIAGTGSTIRNTFENYNKVPVVGKTGSTQSDRDAWFMGYSPDITVGVWAGYDENGTLNISQGAGHRAKNIWSMIMDQAIELKPGLFTTEAFEKPENIVSKTVSSVTGKLPSTLASENKMLNTDIFNKAYLPEEQEDALTRMKVVNFNNRNYIALASTPEDMIQEKVVVKREEDIEALMDQIEEILNNMSASNRPKKRGGAYMTVQDYYPVDMHLTAPSKEDPRVDDGAVPNPPTNVQVSKISDTQNKITFDYSANEDIVGYRFYRSFGGSPFTHIPQRNIYTGQTPEILDGISPSYDHAYYLTAVDVAGKESAPSQIVSNNPDYGNLFLPGGNDDGSDTGNNGGTDDGVDDGTGGTDEDPSGEDNTSSDRPSAPRNVAVEYIGGLISDRIIWDANPKNENIIRYHIYYSGEKNGQYTEVGTSNTTRFESTILLIEGWYRITAENSAGQSVASEAVQYEQG
jgi:penicillin-binding protein